MPPQRKTNHINYRLKCFPVHSQSPSSHPKMSPKISPNGHTQQTEQFADPLPLVEKNITLTRTKDFVYLNTTLATTPKISSKITSNLWKVMAHSTTTAQSPHFITRTPHDLWHISEINYTSFLNSPLLQLQPQNQPRTPNRNSHPNPTTHFRATCSTK